MAEAIQVQVGDLLPDRLQIEQTVKEALSKEQGMGAARLAWGVIGSQASDSLKSVLNMDALDVLSGAWAAAKQLHEFTDRSKHPEGERSVVYLGGHKFTKSLYPMLAVTIEPFKCVTLRFTLNIVANVRSVALTILNGSITGTGAGDLDLGAQLNYGSLALNKLQSKKVQFPGQFALKAPGVPIL
jgi:hypothetical protein